jgi:hypothetical protein
LTLKTGSIVRPKSPAGVAEIASTSATKQTAEVGERNAAVCREVAQLQDGRQPFAYRITEGLPVMRGQSDLAPQHADSALFSREHP